MNNQEVLLRAVEIYALENDSLPGFLSHLERQHLERALAAVLQEKGAWKIKLAYCLQRFSQRGLAYAVTDPWLANYVDDLQVLTCPSFPQALPSSGVVSYGINKNIENMTYHDYKDDLNVDPAVLVVAACPDEFFKEQGHLAEPRHERNGREYILGICKDGTVVCYYEDEGTFEDYEKGSPYVVYF